MKLQTFLVSAIGLVLAGCSAGGWGSTHTASKFFNENDYDRGIAVFTEKVRAEPRSAVNNYYLGRFYLAESMVDQALVYLNRAVSLEPGDSDYQFWLGMAAGAAGDQREERRRYEKALQINSFHAKAKMYLAHLELKAGRYRQALELYDELLRKYPYNAAALYNRALSLRFLDNREEERKALRKYLKYYPAGFLATKATDYLNRLGDFTFRNHPFGYRTITVKKIKFSDDDPIISSRDAMRFVGAILANLSAGDLQISVFVDGNSDLARRRAENIKKFLLKEYPQLQSDRVKLSWFGEPEILHGNGQKFVLSESTRFYLINWQEGLAGGQVSL